MPRPLVSLLIFSFISFDDQKKRTKEKSRQGRERCQKLAVLVSAELNSLRSNSNSAFSKHKT